MSEITPLLPPSEPFDPHAVMSWRLRAYLRRVCAQAGVPFDPSMSRGQARELLIRLGVLVTQSEGGA